MGTLGSGNHYLEVQRVATIFDAGIARQFALAEDDIVISIHCGSRGLGHQIGTDYLREMLVSAPDHGIELPDRELACAPIRSELGQRYLGAMRAGRVGQRNTVGHRSATDIPGRTGRHNERAICTASRISARPTRTSVAAAGCVV